MFAGLFPGSWIYKTKYELPLYIGSLTTVLIRTTNRCWWTDIWRYL